MTSPGQFLMEAVRLHRAGRLAEADAHYARVLAANGNHVDALQLSGMLASQSGNHDRAVALIGKAIRLSGAKAPAPFHNNIGLAYRGLGQIDSAIGHFRRAIALKPDYADAFANLGTALLTKGLLDAAAAACRSALALKPDFASAYYTLGVICRERGQMAEAAACFSRTVSLRPDHADAHNNLGGLCKLEGALDRAAAHYRKAITIRPDDADALFNLGMVLHEREEIEAATDCYRHALRHAPEDAAVHVNLAMALLSQGNFASGLPEYEWRWKMAATPARDLAGPPWRGEAIAGRTILLHAEQGYGDTLQFVRYAPLVARRGAKVILRVPASLARLMASVEGVSAVISEGDPVPAFDWHCPLMSLKLAFATTVETIPGSVPYLKADPARTRFWKERLAGLPGLKVGLVWAGAPRPFHPDAEIVDRKRSLALDQFEGCAAVPGVTLVSLQKGDPARQVATAQGRVALQDWTDELTDFAETAALVDILDLVIGVDTSVIHLAGALGRPVWMLNRFDSCWRWLRGRDDTPWYPTMKLFRQTAPGDWAPVIARVRSHLAALARADGRP